MLITASIPAHAGTIRTFVSTIGNDTNTSGNCSPQAPCRTLDAALSVTTPGGEIVVLTSNGYDYELRFITQPVTIIAVGVDASIMTETGITINTTGDVTLVGLRLNGEGTVFDGITVQQVGHLRLYNMLIENFEIGVDFGVKGSLEISGSSLNANRQAGLFVSGPASVSVNNTSFSNSDAGVEVTAGRATVADSSAEYNGHGFLASGGTLTLVNDRAIFNTTSGLETDQVGALYFANCLIANNTMAYNVASGSTMAGTNPGSSLITPGQSTTGTLSTASALH